jgi:hypothetical protein
MPQTQDEDSMDLDDDGVPPPSSSSATLPAYMHQPELFGHVRRSRGHWASLVRTVTPLSGTSEFVQEFEDNEAAFSLCLVTFHSQPNEVYLVVGSAKDVVLSPRTCTSGYLCLYRILDHGTRLELVHKVRISPFFFSFFFY